MDRYDRADKQTDDWLKQQVVSGRLSQDEYTAVSLDRESSGCIRPEWREWLSPVLPIELQLEDAEIYINYPAWTEQEIANRLGMSKRAVQRALARVRRTYPSLRNDPDGRQGLPNLSHMQPIDSGSYEEIGEGEHRF